MNDFINSETLNVECSDHSLFGFAFCFLVNSKTVNVECSDDSLFGCALVG